MAHPHGLEGDQKEYRPEIFPIFAEKSDGPTDIHVAKS
jgi:hypothetical protein